MLEKLWWTVEQKVNWFSMNLYVLCKLIENVISFLVALVLFGRISYVMEVIHYRAWEPITVLNRVTTLYIVGTDKAFYLRVFKSFPITRFPQLS